MKIKFLAVAAAALLITSCGGGSEEEKTAQLFCDCGTEMAEMSAKMKEDPTSVDMTAYMTAAETFGKCIDPDGKMKEKEDAMDDEAKKAYGEKMKELVGKSCPDIASAMGM
jgi:hypothetical protein